MNCERFQMVTEDLVRNDSREVNPRGLMIMDTSERSIALAHVAACEACALTLTEQSELTESLRNLAEQMRAVQAPPHVEAQLLAAQRMRTQSLALRSNQPRRLYWITAVAAILVLVFGIMVWRGRPISEPPVSTADKSDKVVDQGAGSARGTQSGLAPVGLKSTVQSSSSGSGDQANTPPQRVSHKASGSARRFAAAQLAKRRREERAIKEQQNALAANAVPAEVVTDFVAVGYGSAMDLQEGGQLVRVELPRLALANFGMPLNMDRVDERVKADVLVGPDGLARAIRFVK